MNRFGVLNIFGRNPVKILLHTTLSQVKLSVDLRRHFLNILTFCVRAHFLEKLTIYGIGSSSQRVKINQN